MGGSWPEGGDLFTAPGQHQGLLSGTSYSQASPWMSVFPLSCWRECNEIHFISGYPLRASS